MNTIARRAGPIGLLLLALLLAACGAPAASPADGGGSEPPAAGTPIEPPLALQDFQLPSSDGGRPLALSELRGKPVLLYFGYTFCPDACPTTLAEFRRVKEALGAEGDQLAVLMVSVDPERDTPEVLARYMQAFDPSFIGLSGDEATLRAVGKQYGLYYQRRAAAEGTSVYLIDHSVAGYLIDKQGRLRMIYSYGTPAGAITPDVRRLLGE